MMCLKIAVLTNLCPPDFDGGLEMSALQMASVLRKRGHDVQVVTSRFRPGYKGSKNEPDWIHRTLTYVEPGQGAISRVVQFLRVMPESLENAAAVRDFLHSRHFDVAYIFGLHRVGLATHVPFVDHHVPVLWHQGDPFLAKQLVAWPRKALPYRWLLENTFAAARKEELRGDYRRIAFVSAFLRDQFEKWGLKPQCAYVVPRGVEVVSTIEPVTARPKPPILLTASRLHPQKGIHLAIQACADLAKRRPDLDWRLEIVGKADMRSYDDRLRTMIQQTGLKERVHLVGQITNEQVSERIRKATAVLSTAIYEEPFGRTLIEALAVGTPLIASKVGAISEIVDDGCSALIYPGGDVRELAAHIERILTDTDLAQKLADGGLARVRERFSLDSVAAAIESIFEEMLAEKEKVACASA